MIAIKIAGCALLCALAASAQEDTPLTIFYSLDRDNVRVHSTSDFDLTQVLPSGPVCQSTKKRFYSQALCESAPRMPYHFIFDAPRWNAFLRQHPAPVDIKVDISAIPGKAGGNLTGWIRNRSGFEFRTGGVTPVPPLDLEIGYARDQMLLPVEAGSGLIALVWMAAWWLRNRALTSLAGGEADRWFGYLSRKQYLGLGVWIVWCFLSGVTDLRGVANIIAGRYGFLFDLGCYFAVPLIASLGIAVSGHAVYHKFRQAEWTLSEMLQQTLATELVAMLPLILLLISLEVWMQWGFLAAAACWVARSVVTHFAASWSTSVQGLSIRALSSGELFDRVSGMAGRAGVKLSSFLVLRSSKGRLRNAFAALGNRVMISDDLLETLNKREVDAVMAHELAHLKHGDPGISAWLLPAAIVANTSWSLVNGGAGDGKWTWILPFVPVGWLAVWIAFQFHSRWAERRADAAAAELTSDPEAMISALGKLARLSLQPVEWGRWQESMLTHPSMQRRANFIAAAAGKAPGWGELILHQPLEGGEHYPPQLPPDDELVFNRQARRAVTRRLLLWRSLAGVFPVALCAWMMLWQPWGQIGAAAFGVSGIAMALLMSQLVDAYSFPLGVDALRRKLAARLGGNGVMFGYSPGATPLIHEEGFLDYDFGFVDFKDGLLRYRGDRARFTLLPDQVETAQSVVGTLHHLDDPGVVVRWRDGDGLSREFRLSPLEAHPRERPEADRLARAIEQWRVAFKHDVNDTLSEPPRAELMGVAAPAYSLRLLFRAVPMPVFFAGLLMAPMGFRNGLYAAFGAAVPALVKGWKAWARSRAPQSAEAPRVRSRWIPSAATGLAVCVAFAFLSYGLGKLFHARPGIFAPIVGAVMGHLVYAVAGSRPGFSLRILAAYLTFAAIYVPDLRRSLEILQSHLMKMEDSNGRFRTQRQAGVQRASTPQREHAVKPEEAPPPLSMSQRLSILRSSGSALVALPIAVAIMIIPYVLFSPAVGLFAVIGMVLAFRGGIKRARRDMSPVT